VRLVRSPLRKRKRKREQQRKREQHCRWGRRGLVIVLVRLVQRLAEEGTGETGAQVCAGQPDLLATIAVDVLEDEVHIGPVHLRVREAR
jgi:hypothetical protein